MITNDDSEVTAGMRLEVWNEPKAREFQQDIIIAKSTGQAGYVKKNLIRTIFHCRCIRQKKKKNLKIQAKMS